MEGTQDRPHQAGRPLRNVNRIWHRTPYFGERCTAYGFETWLLVQNPGENEASVSVYAMREGGESKVGQFNLGAFQRKTLRMNDYCNGNLSIRVESSGPVACERAVYWNNRDGGTCSIGYSK